MNIYPEGTFTGRYEASLAVELVQADYVIGHEFAYREREKGFGVVNEAIAQFIADRYANLPIYAAPTVVGALQKIAPHIEVAGIFVATSSNTTASEGGTWSELQQAIEMAGGTRKRPLHVGQAYHIGRIAAQSEKAGLRPIVPPRLPEEFDPESAQWWCRNSALWAAREMVGVPWLRHLGHMPKVFPKTSETVSF